MSSSNNESEITYNSLLEQKELIDDFAEEGNMVANNRSQIWSPPGNYLDDNLIGESPNSNFLEGNLVLKRAETEEEREIKRERRKLRNNRRRSSSFVIVPSRLTTATFNLTNTIIYF